MHWSSINADNITKKYALIEIKRIDLEKTLNSNEIETNGMNKIYKIEIDKFVANMKIFSDIMNLSNRSLKLIK